MGGFELHGLGGDAVAQFQVLSIEGFGVDLLKQAQVQKPVLLTTERGQFALDIVGLGEPLVGVLCGRVDKKVRYYRHRRGRRGYRTGAVFNKLIHAQTIESGVLGAARKFFLEAEDLRDRILSIVREQIQQVDTADLDDLKKQREQLRRKTELIVTTLDEETIADAQAELDRLKVRRRELDQQIAKSESATAMNNLDPEIITDEVLEQIRAMADGKDLPVPALRAWLATVVDKVVVDKVVVDKVVVDLETRNIEISLTVPDELITKAANSAEKPMRLVGTSASPSGYETHRIGITILLVVIDCQFQRASNHICYDCRRRSAA